MSFNDIISQLPAPFYLDSNVAIYNADCRELLLPENSVDLYNLATTGRGEDY